MKKQISVFLLVAVLAAGLYSCKSKPKDADIKAAVEKALAADPMAAGMSVSVDKGVVTLSGECKDDMCKASCEKIAAGVKGVDKIVNNCTIAAPPPPPVQEPSQVSLNEQALTDALKDHPGLKGEIKDGKIVLTGSIEKTKWKMLKQTLDKISPAGYDLTGLKVK